MTDDLKRYMPQAKLAPKTRGPGNRYIGVMNEHPEGKWVRLDDVALLRMQAEETRRTLAAERAERAAADELFDHVQMRAEWAEAQLAESPQPKGDYHEGIQEGWKAGEAQERRIWEEAVRLSLGTIPEGLRNALVEVRKGIEGDD